MKVCAGAGEKSPHPAYIYKNIDGKQYCKQCALYLNPPKPLNKGTKGLSSKPKKIDKDKVDKQWEFFKEIWDEREHRCEQCNTYLGSEPASYMFDHLLEKSQYPELAYEKENIFLCCLQCHSNKTNGFPGDKHHETINKMK